MKNIFRQFFVIIILLSCNKDNESDYPLIQTGEVTNINSYGAVFTAKLIDLSKEDIPEYGFVWSSEITPAIYSSKIIDLSQNVVISELIKRNQLPGLTYFARAFCQNKRM